MKRLRKRSKADLDENRISMDMIRENPHLYCEINIIEKKTEMIQTFYTFAKDREFVHNNFIYKLEPEGMNLIPTGDSFIPLYVFNEGSTNPVDFKNMNERIPGRVLTLLYNLDTYRILIQMEFKKLNLILVIIGIATLIILFAYGYIHLTDAPIPWVRG